MQSLTCPVPSDISPLQNNGFRFGIQKLPEVTFFCQEVTLPGLDLPAAEFSNPLVTTPIPGEKLSFGDLSIVFLIDSQMTNYVAVHNWLVGLGFPQSHDQYKNFISSRTDDLNRNELLAGYSDGTLSILNAYSKPIKSIEFVNLFPVSLSSIQLQSTVTDTVYLAGNANFRYTYYRFV